MLLVNLKLLGLWDAPLSGLADYVGTVSRATGVVVPPGYPNLDPTRWTATGVHASRS